ncbi:MAG: hypothetical protein A2842_02835 [Candidatus Wildermuthbacteria bacterium RIFCSPHIGHO2_01_FULL_48_25]|uniref:Uncharacterized protein n=1 Tax=Candidatus Wildermuthbacteria bacterium RIFCSPLOWO2_01_FULL_48_16 TaxID=1802461 RepID=A0A1G2RJT9_9BACT|nr:MAG: hypothetical protein A2842_02835 [Candidatus Wildermuthbacteria bacterium RIFCSPHIGHO2_01_FULL_48_25]OHA68420.1 MAG: hypothetical protein A3J57_00985 [Candidatus Wildermuthbacteria bacterium RIFCSPHIGHO2_02_FULL_49_12b]OHA73037.1 MAG: hypothetical protein A3B24_01320 [Candidatus Wildermuthbacteria bacterium RIFCSPLOWO2_01_FULL_48_16]
MVTTTPSSVVAKTGSEDLDVELLRKCIPHATITRREGVGGRYRINFFEIVDPKRGTKLFLSERHERGQSGFVLKINLGDLQYEPHHGDHHHFADLRPPRIKKVVYHIDSQGGFVDFCNGEDLSEETFGVKSRIRVFGGFFVSW